MCRCSQRCEKRLSWMAVDVMANCYETECACHCHALAVADREAKDRAYAAGYRFRGQS